jgi:lysophospholipase L1-like esterase
MRPVFCGQRHVRFRRGSGLRTAGLASAAWLTVGCSNPALPTTTIIIPPPAIMCPATPAPAIIANGQSVAAAVSYGTPTVTGGTAPISTTCTPQSGSSFDLGSTMVTCTATDAVLRTASCSFLVTVALPPQPRLGVTRILAFGDSITEGEVPGALVSGIRLHDVEPDESYPADLVTLLAQRYTAQGASRLDAFCTNDPPSLTAAGILVVNAGCFGENAEDATTLARLNDKIATYHPDVVLLLEGVNDLTIDGTASISPGVQGVLALVGAARSRGIRVMVGTLLPAIVGEAGVASLIVPFNTQLEPAVTNAGAQVVDLYSDIMTDVTDWISPLDGLHPTVAGYQEMARVWFNSIQSAFELPPSSTVTAGTRVSTSRSRFNGDVLDQTQILTGGRKVTLSSRKTVQPQ